MGQDHVCHPRLFPLRQIWGPKAKEDRPHATIPNEEVGGHRVQLCGCCDQQQAGAECVLPSWVQTKRSQGLVTVLDARVTQRNAKHKRWYTHSAMIAVNQNRPDVKRTMIQLSKHLSTLCECVRSTQERIKIPKSEKEMSTKEKRRKDACQS